MTDQDTDAVMYLPLDMDSSVQFRVDNPPNSQPWYGSSPTRGSLISATQPNIWITCLVLHVGGVSTQARASIDEVSVVSCLLEKLLD